MRVLLLNPPYEKDKIFRKSMKNLGAVLPPLGIAYIAAVLEKDRHTVKIIDGPAMATVLDYGFSELGKDIHEFQPEIIGLSASTSQVDYAKKTITIIKEVVPNAIIILGGPLISATPDSLLEFPEVAYGAYGEADLTFSVLLQKIENKEPLENVEGVIWREQGKVKFLKPAVVRDLDQIPMPARHLLPMHIYRPSPANYRRTPATTMMTSRGCPYLCIFCSRPTEGTQFRYHSAERVVEEMEHLINVYGIKDIQIFDDTFTLVPSRTEKICNLILEKKLDISWNCMTRIDKVTPELLKLMKAAGCYEVGIGIESGSDRVLQFIKKSLTTDKVREGVRWAHTAGLDVRGFFMIGFPTETKEEILQTIEFAKELDVDVAQFMVATPFPGTEMWDIAKKMGTINDDDWSNFTFYAPNQAPFTSSALSGEEITELYKKAFTSFYLRPKYMFKQFKKIKSLNDIERNWMALKGVVGI